MIHDQQDSITTAIGGITLGGGLLLTNYWAELLTEIGFLASVGAQFCGLIIGSYGVYRIIRRHRWF